MPTLVLRKIPDHLYRRLKQAAADHRRSMTQEAIVSLQAGLNAGPEPLPKPSVDGSLAWLRCEVWSLPTVDAMQHIRAVPLDRALADMAADADRHFGKGWHPAGLNYGDCLC